jgi:cytochrome P450
MLDTWREGQTLDVHREMMRLTLEVVAKTLFGAEMSDADGVGEALEVAMDRFSSQGSLVRALDNYLPTPGWLRLKKAAARLDRLIYGLIEQRRESTQDGADLLSMLLSARDEDGSHMTDQQLRDEAMTLFLAGHETTALALSWSFYLLGQNPEAEAALAREVRSVLGGREPEAADAPRLHYTGQIIRESMRLYPPAWSIGREAIDDCELGGYFVPRRSQVFAVQWTTHRDPRFFDDPLAFKPERWTSEFQESLPRFAYLPFGGGPRICIGNQFATMEATLILAAVARRFRLRLASDEPITPWPSITLRPKQGVKVRVEEQPPG